MRLACVFWLCAIQLSLAASGDHLIPRSNLFLDYHEMVRRRLGVTPFDCGRIILTADLGPEGAVAIYSKRDQYFVTETAAITPTGQGLWQARETHEHLKFVQARR